jgi:integrase
VLFLAFLEQIWNTCAVAAIDKRSGHWRVQVRRRGHPVQHATFDTRKQAEDWAKAIEGDMARGRFIDTKEAEHTSLAEALDRYVAEVTPRKRGASRKETYIAAALQRHPLAGRPLAAIRGADIAAFIRELEGHGLGNQRIRLHLELISHLFTACKTEWGMESLSNPVQLIKRPKPAPPRERRLEGDEETRLFAACPAPLQAVVEFALETAARQGEITALTWEHVDLVKRTAHLPDTKIGEPRTIPLSPAAVALLSRLPRRIDGSVFGLTPNAIQIAFRKACRAAGIENLHFHDLRHEATSRLFERGWNPMEVAAVTGHKTLQMLKRYTHLRAEDLARKLAGEA